MWIVNRCVRKYNDVFKKEVAQFTTLEKADEFIDNKPPYDQTNPHWFDVDKE